MPTTQAVAVEGGSITVTIPDPLPGPQGDKGDKGDTGSAGAPGTGFQIPDVVQSAAGQPIVLDCQMKPYVKATCLIVGGPVAIQFVNRLQLCDIVLYTRHGIVSPPVVTWDADTRTANGTKLLLTPAPSAGTMKTDRFVFSYEQTSPSAYRLVGQRTDANVGLIV